MVFNGTVNLSSNYTYQGIDCTELTFVFEYKSAGKFEVDFTKAVINPIIKLIGIQLVQPVKK